LGRAEFQQNDPHEYRFLCAVCNLLRARDGTVSRETLDAPQKFQIIQCGFPGGEAKAVECTRTVVVARKQSAAGRRAPVPLVNPCVARGASGTRHSDGSPSWYVLALQVRTLGSVAQTLRKISAGLYQLRPALPRVTRTSENAEVGPRGFGIQRLQGPGVERHGCIRELEGWSFTGRWKNRMKEMEGTG
jgi:hypothetical protein